METIIHWNTYQVTSYTDGFQTCKYKSLLIKQTLAIIGPLNGKDSADFAAVFAFINSRYDITSSWSDYIYDVASQLLNHILRYSQMVSDGFSRFD